MPIFDGKLLPYPKQEWPFGGDVDYIDYGGYWIVEREDNLVLIIRVDNPAEWGKPPGLYVDLLMCDLESPALESALSCSGWYLTSKGNIADLADSVLSWPANAKEGDPQRPSGGSIIARKSEDPERVFQLKVDALINHGASATLHHLAETFPAEEEDEEWDAEDEDAALSRIIGELYENRYQYLGNIDKPANKMGSTGRDFMNGDCMAGLRRKASAVLFMGAEEAHQVDLTDGDRIVLQMYNASEGHTLGGVVESELAAAGKMLREGEQQKDK